VTKDFPTLDVLSTITGRRDPEPRSLGEVMRTPVLLLTDAEVAMLDADGQAFARRARAQKSREESCSGHERVGTSRRDEAQRGWHRAECRHCGMDMSVDSGG